MKSFNKHCQSKLTLISTNDITNNDYIFGAQALAFLKGLWFQCDVPLWKGRLSWCKKIGNLTIKHWHYNGYSKHLKISTLYPWLDISRSIRSRILPSFHSFHALKKPKQAYIYTKALKFVCIFIITRKR